jgi:hypothetical protein
LVAEQSLYRCRAFVQALGQQFGGKVNFQGFGAKLTDDSILIFYQPYDPELARVTKVKLGATVQVEYGADKSIGRF